MKLKLAHVCLGSPDLAKSEDFYGRVLGMRRVFDFVKNGARFGFYFEVGDGTFIEVFQGEKVPRIVTSLYFRRFSFRVLRAAFFDCPSRRLSAGEMKSP
jgi:catechol 2,3-dioxygenase-like lactoylglutathione lyase family enzyme